MNSRMHIDRRSIAAGALAFLVIAVAGTGHSHAGHVVYGLGELTFLDQLLGENGNVIIAGDKRFSNFVYTPTGSAPDAEDVAVVGFFDDVEEGFGLQFSGDFTAGPFVGDSMDAGLSFTVEALDPNYLISDVHLFGTLEVFGNGSVSIVEAINGVPVDSLSIRKIVVDGQQGPTNNRDWVIFEEEIGVIGYRRLRVTKDIRAIRGDGIFDEASVTTFTQVFTQRQIPEPSTLVLVLMGLGLTLGMARRKRK